MIILYVNNYRGFQDTYIPLTDVNFLVGENSTGKTSILSLLQVLSSSRFWDSQEFGLDNMQLAYFKEVITSGCKDDFFEVAMFNEIAKDSNIISAYHIKFNNRDSTAFVSEYSFLHGNTTFKVKINSDKMYLYARKLPEHEADFGTFFQKWISENNASNIELLVEIKNDLSYNLPFFYIQSTILSAYYDFNLKNKTTLDYEKYLYQISKIKEPNYLGYLGGFIPIAPIRAKPQRIYEGYKVSFTTEGDHIPYLLKSIMESANHSDIKKNVEIFGDNSGLFEKLQIKKLGNDNISPFEIHISLNGNVMKLTNVGYGVSQILPILVEILSKKDGTWFAIQQPEVHLHPKAQAALGELFFNIAKAENKSFLIETHSDYLIDRYRLALRRANKKTKKPTSNAQVLFFERTAEGNKIHVLPIDERGDYPEEQPEGFRDFFINEQINLLTY